MKWWVAQDDSGLIHIFSEKPERGKGIFQLNQWFVSNGISVCLNNEYTSKRTVKECNVEYTNFADMLGFKRKWYKKGIVYYEGISMKEAKEVEIEFNLKML